MESVVLMYHFINDDNSNFSNLKGISTNQFYEQLKVLLKKYRPISHEEILKSTQLDKFPENTFYLTFDDGTKDHSNNVLPIIKDLGLTASFFPVPQPLIDGVVPIIEKQRFLQYIGYEKYSDFLNVFCSEILKRVPKGKRSVFINSKENIEKSSTYLKHLTYYNNKERFYRKIRDLFLDSLIFEEIINNLFSKFYSDEISFIDNFYMSFNDLKLLISEGMTLGAHTYSHSLLSKLSDEECKNEIVESIDILQQKLLCKIESFAYPNGVRTQVAESILKSSMIKYSFGVGNLKANPKVNRFNIPRIDAASFESFLA
jgi:peptidoglycan/xylan/chitin deacetylase (PgdA/CDA1 family)